MVAHHVLCIGFWGGGLLDQVSPWPMVFRLVWFDSPRAFGGDSRAKGWSGAEGVVKEGENDDDGLHACTGVALGCPHLTPSPVSPVSSVSSVPAVLCSVPLCCFLSSPLLPSVSISFCLPPLSRSLCPCLCLHSVSLASPPPVPHPSLSRARLLLRALSLTSRLRRQWRCTVRHGVSFPLHDRGTTDALSQPKISGLERRPFAPSPSLSPGGAAKARVRACIHAESLSLAQMPRQRQMAVVPFETALFSHARVFGAEPAVGCRMWTGMSMPPLSLATYHHMSILSGPSHCGRCLIRPVTNNLDFDSTLHVLLSGMPPHRFASSNTTRCSVSVDLHSTLARCRCSCAAHVAPASSAALPHGTHL